jgi:hypothetical protein
MSEPARCQNCGAVIVARNGETFGRMWTEDEDGGASEAWYCVDCTVQEPSTSKGEK